MSAAIAEVGIANHPVVSQEQWVAERRKLLAREKELTRVRDQIARERRSLPWVRIEKAYVFDAPEGRRTLAVVRPWPALAGAGAFHGSNPAQSRERPVIENRNVFKLLIDAERACSLG